MDSIAELLKSLSINNFEVGSSHWVDVTHINNPHSFYVRPTVYRMHMPIIHSYGDRVHSTDLQLGQNVIYKSKLVQCFVRGQMLYFQTEGGETTCDLYAPDYGCFEKSVPLKRIRKPIYTVNIPPLAIHCQLADCQPQGETWTRKVIECMKFFVGKERAKMDIRGKTQEAYLVDLNNSCPDDIATMLALCGYTTLGYGENIVSVFPSTTDPGRLYFTFKELKVGDELTVRVQTGESLLSFFVALVADYKQYLSERDDFTSFAKQASVFKAEDVKVGLPVAVLLEHNTKYERAVIKEITQPDSRVKVQLIDWGKIQEVPYTRLKPIPSAFFLRNATAIYCSAEESQAWDNGLQKFLYPGYEFNIIVIAEGDKFDAPYIVNISPKPTTNKKKK